MDEKTITKKIGKRIQKLRKEKGYTQITFAEAVGLSNNYLSCVERGVNTPRMDKFVVIMNTLGCSADDLFCDVIDYGYKLKSSRLSEKLETLSDEDRSKVLTIIEALIDEANAFDKEYAIY